MDATVASGMSALIVVSSKKYPSC